MYIFICILLTAILNIKCSYLFYSIYWIYAGLLIVIDGKAMQSFTLCICASL